MEINWAWIHNWVINMVGVLVDACGWAALIDAKLNMDLAMIGVIGEFELILIKRVKDELETLSKSKRGLLLDLLEMRSTLIPDIKGIKYTDDMLIKFSIDNSWPVLTVDKELKERLIIAGGSYIEVTSRRVLKLIGLRKGE
ncbi:MAG: rRNA-processing protein FCF1 [Candidatus Thalassarchaeaceae archaeon]|jgi:rRNA-processing protein FCF1